MIIAEIISKEVIVPQLPEPAGSIDIPPGTIRLYHQTDASTLKKIEKHGLLYRFAKGIEGPTGIYASPTPFYGKAKDIPTLEFYVPVEWWDPPLVTHDVPPSLIIAAHYPWHKHARYFEKNTELIQNVIDGEFDDLGGDYPTAIEYIKQKYS
jgi:hypothetical protein